MPISEGCFVLRIPSPLPSLWSQARWCLYRSKVFPKLRNSITLLQDYTHLLGHIIVIRVYYITVRVYYIVLILILYIIAIPLFDGCPLKPITYLNSCDIHLYVQSMVVRYDIYAPGKQVVLGMTVVLRNTSFEFVSQICHWFILWL